MLYCLDCKKENEKVEGVFHFLARLKKQKIERSLSFITLCMREPPQKLLKASN